MIRIRIIPIAAILLTGACLLAQDAKLTARVDAERIGLDDTLRFSVIISGVENPAPPALPGLTDFDVQSRSQATEIRMVNGRTSLQTSFEFDLAPKRTGTLTIPALRYEVQGRVLSTRPIQVEVVSGSVAPPSRQRSPFADDFFGFQREAERSREPVDVRLVTDLSPRSVVPGQQVMLQVRLLTRNTVRAVNLLSEPSIPGFWQEWFPVPRSSEGRIRQVDGKDYTEYDIRKVALFPDHSGTLTIPALEFEVFLEADSLSFFAEPRRIVRSTESGTIHVLPLPADAVGMPVGDFDLAVDPLPAEVNAQQMASLRVRIRGNGNMKTLEVPRLAAGPMWCAGEAISTTSAREI